MYRFQFSGTFQIARKKLIKGDKPKEKKEKKTLRLLMRDPFYPSLKSHKVNTQNFGQCWSSWVTGDLRIIWKFGEDDKLIIILLTLASHSGTHKEYK